MKVGAGTRQPGQKRRKNEAYEMEHKRWSRREKVNEKKTELNAEAGVD